MRGVPELSNNAIRNDNMHLLRVEYAVYNEAVFLSHLEMVRNFERALRRAEVPIAFSEGFNPHPKTSIAAPLPVGIGGEHEYLELELQSKMQVEEFNAKVNGVLPEGIKILRSRYVATPAKTLMAVINAASYLVELDAEKVNQNKLRDSIKLFLAKESVIVTRHTPKGDKSIDVRKGVYEFKTAFSVLDVELEMLLVMGNDGNIRPEEVVRAIFTGIDEDYSDAIVHIKRNGLFIYRDGQRLVPLNFGSEELV